MAVSALASAFASLWQWLNKQPPAIPVASKPSIPIPPIVPVVATPLLALPLRYLIAVETQIEGKNNEIIEVGYDGPLPKRGIGIRYGNLLNQTKNDYSPYLKATDTADQYGEKVVDPKGAGWTKLLSDQCQSAIAAGFHFIEWDNPDSYSQAAVLEAVGYAQIRTLQVVAKNPLSCSWDGVPYLAHKAVVGCVVERDAGSPADMDALRRKAGKPDLPVWFVAFRDVKEDGNSWAVQTASLARSFKNMWVTFSVDGEYTSAQDVPVLRPVPPSPIPPPSRSNFEPCVKLVLVHEGGNDDDPHDPGGRTSRGITAGDWDRWRTTHSGLPSDVWKAPQDQIIAVYREFYWNALKCDTIVAGLDYCVFDCGVLDGIHRAQPWFELVKSLAPAAAINKFCDVRLARLQGLSNWARYGHGWGTRVADVRRDALAMVRGAAVEPPKVIPPLSSQPLHDLGNRLKRTMLAKGYPWFPDQNVISVEGMDPDGTPNRNRNNAFDDIKAVLDGDGKIIGGPWEGTTQPGVYWTEHPMASGGAFIIALGSQACWTPGPYHEHTVWRQADDSSIMGHRDPEATYVRQGPPIKHGDIGVHHHGGYNLSRDNIANAAAGCQVIRLTDKQQEFMDLTMKCPRFLADKKGYRLTATVLQAKDILA